MSTLHAEMSYALTTASVALDDFTGAGGNYQNYISALKEVERLIRLEMQTSRFISENATLKNTESLCSELELTTEQKGILWTAMKSNYVQLEKDGVFWNIDGVDVVMGTLTLTPLYGVGGDVVKPFTFSVASMSVPNMTFCAIVKFEVGGTPNGLKHLVDRLEMLDNNLKKIYEHARVVQNDPVNAEVCELFKETLAAIPRVLTGPTDGTNHAIRIWYNEQGWNDNFVMQLFNYCGKCSGWSSMIEDHMRGGRFYNMAELCRQELRQILSMMKERVEQLAKEHNHDHL